jgi:hypothetical protein
VERLRSGKWLARVSRERERERLSVSLLPLRTDQTRHYLSPMINDSVTRLCVHTYLSCLMCTYLGTCIVVSRRSHSTDEAGRRQRALQYAAERAASHRSLSRRFVFARSCSYRIMTACLLLMILLRLMIENNGHVNTSNSS